jgi:hypothetical protein
MKKEKDETSSNVKHKKTFFKSEGGKRPTHAFALRYGDALCITHLNIFERTKKCIIYNILKSYHRNLTTPVSINCSRISHAVSKLEGGSSKETCQCSSPTFGS